MQNRGVEVVEKNGVMTVKTTNVYYETFQKLLARGAYKDLKKRAEQGISATAQPIEKFSPNNVRRVILGLDGIFVQFFVGSSEFQAKQQFQPVNLTEQLIFELVDPNTKSTPVLKVLHGDRKSVMGDRIFSSLEEIVIINSTPNFEGTFNNTGLDWFINNKATVLKSFKRLRAVSIVTTPITVSDFIEQHKSLLDDPLRVLYNDIQLDKRGGFIAGEDYVTRTSLRPQYYKLDEAESPLAKYFERTKQAYYDNLVTKSNKDGAESKSKSADLGISAGTLASLVDFTGSFIEEFAMTVPVEDMSIDRDAITGLNSVVSHFTSVAQDKSWDTQVGYSGSATGTPLETLAVMVELWKKNIARFEKGDLIQLQASINSLAYISYKLLDVKGVKDDTPKKFALTYKRYSDQLERYTKCILRYGTITRDLLQTAYAEGIEGQVDEVVEEVVDEIAEEAREEVASEKSGLDYFAEIVELHDTGRVRPTMDELYVHLFSWLTGKDVVTPEEVLGQVNDFFNLRRDYLQAFNYIYKRHGLVFKGSGKEFPNLKVAFGGSVEATNENVFASLKGIFKHEVPEVQRDLGALFEKAERLARGEEI